MVGKFILEGQNLIFKISCNELLMWIIWILIESDKSKTFFLQKKLKLLTTNQLVIVSEIKQ